MYYPSNFAHWTTITADIIAPVSRNQVNPLGSEGWNPSLSTSNEPQRGYIYVAQRETLMKWNLSFAKFYNVEQIRAAAQCT